MAMKENFSRWPELGEFLNEIKELLNQSKRPPDQIILDEADAIAFLKVSKRCLAKWRAEGVIPSKKLGGKIYYVLSELLDAIKNNNIIPPIKPKF